MIIIDGLDEVALDGAAGAGASGGGGGGGLVGRQSPLLRVVCEQFKYLPKVCAIYLTWVLVASQLHAANPVTYGKQQERAGGGAVPRAFVSHACPPCMHSSQEVRFFITSRPEVHIQRALGRAFSKPFTIWPTDPRHQDDLRRMIQTHIADKLMSSAAAAAQQRAQRARSTAARKAAAVQQQKQTPEVAAVRARLLVRKGIRNRLLVVHGSDRKQQQRPGGKAAAAPTGAAGEADEEEDWHASEEEVVAAVDLLLQKSEGAFVYVARWVISVSVHEHGDPVERQTSQGGLSMRTHHLLWTVPIHETDALIVPKRACQTTCALLSCTVLTHPAAAAAAAATAAAAGCWTGFTPGHAGRWPSCRPSPRACTARTRSSLVSTWAAVTALRSGVYGECCPY